MGQQLEWSIWHSSQRDSQIALMITQILAYAWNLISVARLLQIINLMFAIVMLLVLLIKQISLCPASSPSSFQTHKCSIWHLWQTQQLLIIITLILAYPFPDRVWFKQSQILGLIFVMQYCQWSHWCWLIFLVQSSKYHNCSTWHLW